MACAIAIMAKAPQAGRCKTRLVPPLTYDQAAALSQAFLRDMTANLSAASRNAPIVPYIAYAPAGLEAAFDGIAAPGTRLILADGVPAAPSGVEGFGRSLLHAMRALLERGFTSACVLNADSPTLPTAILCDAALLLESPGDRAVMAAAADGGYTLLGMKSAHAALFTDIEWSTARVADQTRDRARMAGIALHELPCWYDVDDAASLMRLHDQLRAPGDAYPAPHTASLLAAMGYGAYGRAAS